MGACENGVECERWLLMASWKEGVVGEVRRGERGRERHGFIEIHTERGSVEVCI